jgi:hypothetical protein
MGDMLQFERERGSESDENTKNERCWSREVKMNRAQILALQEAERDGYREQNEVLRL